MKILDDKTSQELDRIDNIVKKRVIILMIICYSVCFSSLLVRYFYPFDKNILGWIIISNILVCLVIGLVFITKSYNSKMKILKRTYLRD